MTLPRPSKVVLRDGRVVTRRPVRKSDVAELVQAFNRLSVDARYRRFMYHKEYLNPAFVERGVRPRPGQDFVFVATVPADDGFDIVGAAQYVPAETDDVEHCEFAITVAEGWRGSGLAANLLASLVRRARVDGYRTMEGLVLADNAPMRALAQKLRFAQKREPGDANVVRVVRVLNSAWRRPARSEG